MNACEMVSFGFISLEGLEEWGDALFPGKPGLERNNMTCQTVKNTKEKRLSELLLRV